jgi:hypothetical protein
MGDYFHIVSVAILGIAGNCLQASEAWVMSPVDNPFHLQLVERAGTHDAWFEGNVHGALLHDLKQNHTAAL